jgi:hypothetical protein
MTRDKLDVLVGLTSIDGNPGFVFVEETDSYYRIVRTVEESGAGRNYSRMVEIAPISEDELPQSMKDSNAEYRAKGFDHGNHDPRVCLTKELFHRGGWVWPAFAGIWDRV